MQYHLWFDLPNDNTASVEFGPVISYDFMDKKSVLL